jgi:hypothetical protein
MLRIVARQSAPRGNGEGVSAPAATTPRRAAPPSRGRSRRAPPA